MLRAIHRKLSRNNRILKEPPKTKLKNGHTAIKTTMLLNTTPLHQRENMTLLNQLHSPLQVNNAILQLLQPPQHSNPTHKHCILFFKYVDINILYNGHYKYKYLYQNNTEDQKLCLFGQNQNKWNTSFEKSSRFELWEMREHDSEKAISWFRISCPFIQRYVNNISPYTYHHSFNNNNNKIDTNVGLVWSEIIYSKSFWWTFNDCLQIVNPILFFLHIFCCKKVCFIFRNNWKLYKQQEATQ
jgi:hypothetical protein